VGKGVRANEGDGNVRGELGGGERGGKEGRRGGKKRIDRRRTWGEEGLGDGE